MKIEVESNDMFTKTVKKSGNSGVIYLPPENIGKKVIVIIQPSE